MIAELLSTVANVYAMILLARVIVSWLPIDRDNTLVRLLDQLTEPVLAPIRSVLPSFGGIDFSPLVALLLLSLLQRILFGL
ncbi:MAG TPA: YggT family protein [Candidatus Krumholzibacteria bacterium]|nr:YggT family protein [Candidatus Krumholzibacteria bacterium]